MKIAIGSDHAGFGLKEEIKKYLKKKGIEFKDFGCHSEESVDYPDYGFPLARAVSKNKFLRGILICGAGIGMSIVANKVKGIRASLCHNLYTVRVSREHNNANILVLGARVLKQKQALKMVDVWLKTKFSAGRHLQRITKIKKEEEI